MYNNYRDISVSICWFVTTTTTTQGSLSVCGREKLFLYVCVLLLCVYVSARVLCRCVVLYVIDLLQPLVLEAVVVGHFSANCRLRSHES